MRRWSRRGLLAAEHQFFEHVLDSDDYPSVPPENPELVESLDRAAPGLFFAHTDVHGAPAYESALAAAFAAVEAVSAALD